MKAGSASSMGGRTVSVELDAEDGLKQWPQKWPSWKVATQYVMLSNLADLFVVRYLGDAALMTADQVSARSAQIKEVMRVAAQQ